jgi:hypothetical protein
VDAEEPLLFHCGQRVLFPAVSWAAARIMDPRRLRWIAFSPIRASGSMLFGDGEEKRLVAVSIRLCGGRLRVKLWLPA